MTPRDPIRSDYIETRRNTRNVHYMAMISRGPDRGCWYTSWMPIAEWTRTVETLPEVLPVTVTAQAGEAITAGTMVRRGEDGKLYAVTL